MLRMAALFFCTWLLNPAKALSQLHLRSLPDSSPTVINIRPLPIHFYKAPPGFFCKKEVQLQRLTRLPLFLRLGSKEQADFFERKNKAAGRWEYRTSFSGH